MMWLPQALGGTRFVSDCGQYELYGRWATNGYEWRGRFIEGDKLIAASADRSFVAQRCEQHAADALAEAP